MFNTADGRNITAAMTTCFMCCIDNFIEFCMKKETRYVMHINTYTCAFWNNI